MSQGKMLQRFVEVDCAECGGSGGMLHGGWTSVCSPCNGLGRFSIVETVHELDDDYDIRKEEGKEEVSDELNRGVEILQFM